MNFIRWQLSKTRTTKNNNTKNISIKHLNNEIKNLEIIGKNGEQIIFEYLKFKYAPKGWDITWSSQNSPYGPYDFELKKDNDVLYVEVKSSSAKILNHFFLSANEYAFYLNNKDKYKLILISNIYEFRQDKAPAIFDRESISIEISDKWNFEIKNNKCIFSIVPNQYVWMQ